MTNITHAFVSPKTDGSDTTVLRPSDWNAPHVGNGLGYFAVEDYGAKGDGSTDDTASIQAAMDAAAASGGTVTFGSGVFITNTLTITIGVELLGAGINATVLKLKSGANAAVIKTLGFAGFTGGNTASGPHSWAIKNLAIDGNKANNTTAGFGLQIYGYGFRIESIRVHDCKTDGIYSEWGSALGTTYPYDMMAVLVDVHCLDNGHNGFTWKGPHDTRFTGCYAYRNGNIGFEASGNGNASIYTDCHSYGIGQVWAFYLATTGCIMTSSTAEGAGSDATTGGQVFVGANDITISGCNIYSADAGAPAASVRGVVIGDGTHANIGGTHINTKVWSCSGGAFVLGSDAGSKINGIVWQAAGAAVSGTRSAQTEINLSVSGGATYFGNLTQSLGVRSGENTKMGTGTLVAGKCQVWTSVVTAASTIFLTVVTPGGTTGVLTAKNIGGTDRSAGAWFFVSSMKTDGTLQNADTSTFNWLLIEAL